MQENKNNLQVFYSVLANKVSRVKALYSIKKEEKKEFEVLYSVAERLPEPSGEGLLHNNNYILEFRYKDNFKKLEFTSELDPFYCSIYQIRSAPVKEFISRIDDEEIMFAIYENSQLARQKAEDGGVSVEGDDIPYALYQYVVAKTKYDIFLNAYLNRSSESSKDYSLADFSVDSGDIDNLNDLLDILKDEYQQWEEELEGGFRGASSLSVVKSEGSYPLSSRSF